MSIMALQWEQEWVDVEVVYKGIKLRVKQDKETKLYACPICGYEEHASFFHTVEDLLHHLLSHVAGRDWKRERIVVASVGEEESGAARLSEGLEEED